jgi:Protein of unknown function (DUF3048) N-terminal domain/Protein of unknown function (DUF3048) C-terminal domain
MRGRTVGLILTSVVAAVAIAAAALAGPGPQNPNVHGGTASPAVPSPAAGSPTAGPAAAASSSPSGNPGAPPSPSVAPSPTPALVPAPLTGRMVTPALAARHPIAVMVDDQAEARPQSGFNAASVVWQAPAEGGIPRYMLIFGEGDPPAVGPVRSSRLYFITWAAEWRALYVHVGGSPQALATLAASGSGQLVYNADEFQWGGTYLWRITQRFPPHNVYTDGKHLRALAARVGATAPAAGPAWTFAPGAPLAERPADARLQITYPASQVAYRYDRASNTYLRFVGGQPQVDAGDGRQVAPANVVVMTVVFGPLNDGNPSKMRLEAQVVGKGPAWIATNGVTIRGTWRKASNEAPTRFYGSDGNEVALTVGQTFIQVVPPGTPVRIVAGTRVVEAPPGTGRART